MMTLDDAIAALQAERAAHGNREVSTLHLAFYVRETGFMEKLDYDKLKYRDRVGVYADVVEMDEDEEAPEPTCDAQRLVQWNQASGTVALCPAHTSKRVSEGDTRTDFTLPDGSTYILKLGRHSNHAFWDDGT